MNQQKMPDFSLETKYAIVGTKVPHPDPKFFFFMCLLSVGSEVAELTLARLTLV